MKNTFILLFVFLSIGFFAQTKDCSKLEAEITKNKSEIAELSKQNLYYKETLNLLTTVKSATFEEMQFDLIKIEGSRIEKTLSVQFIYKSLAKENRNFLQFEQALGIDPQGNQFHNYEVSVAANSGIRVENIQPNIPIKGSVVFQVSETDFPLIRILKMKVFSKDLSNPVGEIVFENIPVSWK